MEDIKSMSINAGFYEGLNKILDYTKDGYEAKMGNIKIGYVKDDKGYERYVLIRKIEE